MRGKIFAAMPLMNFSSACAGRAVALQGDYLPSQPKADDYPALIPACQRIDTIAVPVILAAYNWASGSGRYKKGRAAKAGVPPEMERVSLAAPFAGWKRFATTQIWLDKHANTSVETRRKFDEFMAMRGSTDKSTAAAPDRIRRFSSNSSNGKRRQPPNRPQPDR